MELEALGAAADGQRVEVSALEQNRPGGLRDLRGLPSHDPGHGDGPLGVGDDQHGGLQGALLLVDGRDGLALAGPAHDDTALGQSIVVESVQRLAPLHEDEVRRIDHVVDGPKTHGGEGFLEPGGRGADGDVPDDSAHVAGTSFGVLDVNAGEGLHARRGLGERHLGQGDGDGGDSRHLTGYTDVREAIGPVGCEVKIEDHIRRALALVHPLEDPDFEADHGEGLGQGLGLEVHLHVAAQPGEADLHRATSELGQKAGVILEEEADVVDAVLQHGYPLHPHAEGEPDHALGVVADGGEDVGVDHAAA